MTKNQAIEALRRAYSMYNTETDELLIVTTLDESTGILYYEDCDGEEGDVRIDDLEYNDYLFYELKVIELG